ncbi:MAG: hypothetical protein QXQ70_03540 [Candidatus Caldarchaeum sp.]
MARSKPPSSRRLLLLGEAARVGERSIVVKARVVPRLAAKVFDSRGREVGYVSNVFGPVAGPLVSVKPVAEKTVKEGEPLYTEKH